MSGRTDRVCRQYGIQRNMPLAQKCADFYLLEMAVREGHKAAQWRLRELASKVATVLEAYLDLAIGGEVRHAIEMCKREDVTSRKLMDYLDWWNDTGDSTDRTDCWVEWMRLRQRDEDLDLLRGAAELFEAEGWAANENVGGPAWAAAARFLITYKQGRMSDVVFLDRCWTLQHNNGFIFDKLLNCRYLMEVLKLQAANDYDALARRFATAEVRGIWYAVRRQHFDNYDPAWYGSGWGVTGDE